MDLKKHIIDTIKEWQLKIGYREGNMKLYYPGESLEAMLGLAGRGAEAGEAEEELEQALSDFCDEAEPQLGRIRISGNYERYCLEVPPKGCAYVAAKVPEPEFLKLFLEAITGAESTLEQVRECFAAYGTEHGTAYIEEEIAEEQEAPGHAFYFAEEAVEEYVYWVEENEFGLTYHRFTRADYEKLVAVQSHANGIFESLQKLK